MSQVNPLSALGRMSYSAHLAFYPVAFAFYTAIVAPYRARGAAAVIQAEVDSMSKAKAVDPDHFSPFSPIPYHNNPELVYVYHGINMRNYCNKNTHINEKEYVWKNYHNSFDHGNKKNYIWNYTRVE